MFWNRRPPLVVLRSLLLSVLLLAPGAFVLELPADILPLDVSWADPRVLLFYLWLLIVTFVLLRLDGRSITSVGLGVHPWTLRELGLGFAVGVAMALVVVVPAGISGGIDPGWTGGRVWDDLLVVLLLAVGEELLFRGYLFQRVVELFGDIIGSILFATLFLLLHLGNPGIGPIAGLNLFLAGLLFSALWLVTRSLWAPIGLHVAWNVVVGPVTGLPISGISMDQNLLHMASGLPDWLDGGRFGPEGGVLGTIAILCGCALLATLPAFRTAPWAYARTFYGELRAARRSQNKPFSG